MSAEFAWSQPAPERLSTPQRILRALPKRTTSRATLPIIATAAVVVVVIGQLLLGVALATGAYEVEGLQHAKAEAVRSQTAATQDLIRVQSPQYIAKNASALGMVANSNTVYLRLSDGAVFGQPTPAKNGATFAGDNVANSLIDGVPLAGQAPATTQATPTPAAEQSPAGSVALQSGSIPAQRTH